MDVYVDVYTAKRLVATAVILCLCAAAFWGGISYSRAQLRSFSAELSRHPTNSFTKCLHDSWAASGELEGNGAEWMLVK